MRSSRFGPTAPDVPASLSVWQLPQLWTKSSLPSAAALVVPAVVVAVVVAGAVAVGVAAPLLFFGAVSRPRKKPITPIPIAAATAARMNSASAVATARGFFFASRIVWTML